MTSSSGGFYFLSDLNSRRVIRIVTLFIYFVIFQSLILVQKPFLQFDFIVVFYVSFAALFGHHLFNLFANFEATEGKTKLFSYFADFAVLMLFMKYFPYLSSFILVLQLFLLFIASFDLSLFHLVLLGFGSSMGVSVINLSSGTAAGSMQSILSLTLFNLSYVSVIVISRQLKSEFVVLQKDLNTTKKKWKTQEEFSKMVIENIPLGIAVFQKDMNLVLQNSYISEKNKLSSLNLLSVLGDFKKGNPHFIHNVDYVYRTEQNEQKVFNIDETDYFDSELDESLNVYLIKDVTEVRELENQKKQNEKMAAIGQLAAGIAHEIRNPLAGISGSIQLLTQDSKDETEQKLMKIILKEIDRLNNLITEFLDYAKPEKMPDKPINLKNTVDEVLMMTKRNPEVSSDFDWQIKLSEVSILGFHEKLKQAILNIIINGIQAMKGRPIQRYEINLKAEGNHAVLSMKDCGSGMSEDTKRKMFEPFHTTKAKGTGLGLAITHKILEMHKAIVIVNSEIDKGTEFIIKFPMTPERGDNS